MQTWYAQRAGQQYGPFDDAALVELVRQGQIGEDDWLTSDFGGHWQAARAVAGLFPHAHPLGVAMPVAPPMPPVVPSAVPVMPMAAVPVQPLPPSPMPVAAVPLAAAPAYQAGAPAYGAPGHPVPPAYGVPAPAYPTAAPAYAPPPMVETTTRGRRYTWGDGMRVWVFVGLFLLLLIFWYAWKNPVPRQTGALLPPVPTEAHTPLRA